MLTDTRCRSLKPQDKVYRVADSHGLALEVRPTGAKLWRYRYRFAGKANMLGLGEYPAVGLADARAERDKARAKLRAGADPAQAAKAERAAILERAEGTFAAIAGELLAIRARKLEAGSVVRERRLLEKDLAPSLGALPIGDISAPQVLAALRKIEARGAIETAHRARALAALVFRFAIQTGRAERNPAADLAGALIRPTTRHFASVTDPAEVGPLLRVLWGYEGSPVVRAALQLAPLVFVRPGELRRARWSDIDLDAAEWRFTASKTKTPHLVPLSPQAVAVLQELRPLTAPRSEYVFPCVRSVDRPMSENTVNGALRRLGIDGDTLTGHGFRAMARTVLDEVLGFRPDFIEAQLAHAVRDPMGRSYNRTAHLPERRAMMAAWADYLDSLRVGANVTALRPRRKAGGE
jgi:integrase